MLTAAQTLSTTTAIELSRAALVKLLDRAKHVVPARCPKPILTCVRLEASDCLLRLQATDGELSLYAHLPVGGELPACVVPLSVRNRRFTCEPSSSAGVIGAEDDPQDRDVRRARLRRAERRHELAVVLEQFSQWRSGGGEKFALGFVAFDLFLDALGGAGVGRAQRVVDRFSGDIVLDPTRCPSFRVCRWRPRVAPRRSRYLVACSIPRAASRPVRFQGVVTNW